MSQYPVESNEQLFQAVNYLLSGPGGLGQDFQGFSAYTTAYLTGNYRIPFTYASVSKVGSGKDAEFTIVLNTNFSGIDIGYTVSGASIGGGATVTALDYTPADGYVVTLSAANTDDIDNETLIFYPPTSIIKPINTDPFIACSSAVQIDDRTFQYNFSGAPLASPPFANGNNLTGSGWTGAIYDGSPFYNGYQGVIGVIKCTTDYVIFRTNGFFPGVGDDFGGGSVGVDNMDTVLSTDCNARVTVTGATDRVFISGQLCNKIAYTTSLGAGVLTYTVQINRYKGQPNNDPINPDFVFVLDRTIAAKSYTRACTAPPQTLDEIDTIFSTVVDSPTPGYYWYILEVVFQVTPSDLIIDSAEFSLRSLSAQVVKQ